MRVITIKQGTAIDKVLPGPHEEAVVLVCEGLRYELHRLDGELPEAADVDRLAGLRAARAAFAGLDIDQVKRDWRVERGQAE